MDSLDEVAQAVRDCADCPLHRGRTNAVPGEGSPWAELMFIGEGPGFHEDRQGRPFVGPAGQLLEGLLASIGTNRNDVFIANMVKCRPPDNRDPEPSEIAACKKYLDRQIELIDPKLIVLLGAFLWAVLPRREHHPRTGQIARKGWTAHFPGASPCGSPAPPRTAKNSGGRLPRHRRHPGGRHAARDNCAGTGGRSAQGPPAEQLGIFGAPSAPPPASPGNATEEPADAPAPEPPGRDDGPQQLSLL